MSPSNKKISQIRIERIKEQGYDTGFTDIEISGHSTGNRFAFQMCTLLFVTGLVLTNIPILAAAAAVALFAVILPYHPFDYLYNHAVRHWLNRPKLPPRSNQAKFACGIASLWISGIILLFQFSMFEWGYILGGILFVIAFLVSTIDFCIPSKIYNALFRRRSVTSRS